MSWMGCRAGLGGGAAGNLPVVGAELEGYSPGGSPSPWFADRFRSTAPTQEPESLLQNLSFRSSFRSPKLVSGRSLLPSTPTPPEVAP